MAGRSNVVPAAVGEVQAPVELHVPGYDLARVVGHVDRHLGVRLTSRKAVTMPATVTASPKSS
jgi:hypothetical protein